MTTGRGVSSSTTKSAVTEAARADGPRRYSSCPWASDALAMAAIATARMAWMIFMLDCFRMATFSAMCDGNANEGSGDDDCRGLKIMRDECVQPSRAKHECVHNIQHCTTIFLLRRCADNPL